jgi:peptidoglycan/LPS O-acetylase OafA/YrhL
VVRTLTGSHRPPGYIPTLDGWRGIAISLVLIGHYTAALKTKHRFLYGLGGIGVSIFFGISGFLICALLLRERDKHGVINLRNFYRKRTFRIFPVAYVFLLVTLILSFFVKLPMDRRDIWPALLFVRNYISPDGGTTHHFWSLAVEEHFYLVLPVLMLVARRRLLAALVVGSILVFVWRSWMGALPHALSRTDYRIDAIMDGSIVAVLAHEYNPLIERLGSLRVGAAAIAVLILSRFVDLSLGRSLVAIAVPFILLATIRASPSVLEWSPLRWLGRISYSVYIWQGLFTGNGIGLLFHQLPWIFNLSAMIGTAVVSYYALEQPLIHIGRRMRSVRVYE